MISYAPFEAEEPQVVIQTRPISRPPQQPVQQKTVLLQNEGTECNYIIFVFIIGILYLISLE